MDRGTIGAQRHARTSTPARVHYLPQLDGLRAIAILLVLVHHAITPVTFGGFIGVDVFFVLSGYLITSILLNELDRTGRIRLRVFYLRRALRLYPPLLLAVAVTFIPAVLVAKHLLYLVIDTGLALTYLTPVALLWNDGISLVYRHTWSLGIEEMFYLVWPAILLAASRLGRSRRFVLWLGVIAGGALLAVCTIQALTLEHPDYLPRAGGILIGCAVAAALSLRRVSIPLGVGWAGVVGLTAAVVVAQTAELSGAAITLAVVSSAAVVAHLATSDQGPLVRALATRPMVYLGQISYELYLWHYSIFVLLGWWLDTTFIHVWWIALPLSFGFAAGSHAVLSPLVARWRRRLV